MTKHNTTISQADSYAAVGEFWDKHELAEFEDRTRPADFTVDIRSNVTYFAVDRDLSQQMARVAAVRGVSAETLLNLWLQEKLLEQPSQ